jgi:hypothetical protein
MISARRGVIQQIECFAKFLPDKVYDAYVRGLNGEDGDKIKTSDLNNLKKANGGSLNRATPTAEFEKAFELAVDTFGEKLPDGERILSATKFNDLGKLLTSKTLRAVFYRVRFGKEIDLTELDSTLLDLEREGLIDIPAITEAVATNDAWLAEKNAKNTKKTK